MFPLFAQSLEDAVNNFFSTISKQNAIALKDAGETVLVAARSFVSLPGQPVDILVIADEHDCSVLQERFSLTKLSVYYLGPSWEASQPCYSQFNPPTMADQRFCAALMAKQLIFIVNCNQFGVGTGLLVLIAARRRLTHKLVYSSGFDDVDIHNLPEHILDDILIYPQLGLCNPSQNDRNLLKWINIICQTEFRSTVHFSLNAEKKLIDMAYEIEKFFGV